MNRLAAIKALVSAADGGGFAAGARALSLSRAQVSRQVAGLEAHIGTRLVERRTRAFALTEAGRRYVERARAILADLGAADRAADPAAGEIAGLLQVAAPGAIGRHLLAPLVAGFMAHHPDLRVALHLDDRFFDPDEDGFDVLVATGGAGHGPGARRLGRVRQVLAATPAYLAARGRPQVPGDLGGHHLVHCGSRAEEPRWALRGGAGPENVVVRPVFRSNSAEAARAAAIAGLGIALLPAFLIADALGDGRLVGVLEGFEPAPLGVHARLAAGSQPGARARSFVDFLTAEFARQPSG